MKQYISKSALVAEIERRLKGLEDCHADTVAGYAGEISGLKRILAFIDTLEVEEVEEEPVSKDLEAEFVLYLKHKFNIPQEGNKLKTNGWKPSPYDILDIARHFAQWQKTKVYEWLKEHKEHPLIGCEDPCLSGYLTDEFIEDFKKAMEE